MFSAIHVISIFSLERSVVYQKLKVGHLVQQKGALGIVALRSFEIARRTFKAFGCSWYRFQLEPLMREDLPFLTYAGRFITIFQWSLTKLCI